MSGIGSCHNKFDSCDGCPDRVADPNCHDTCRGNLWRMAENKRKKAAQRAETDYVAAKCDAVKKAKTNKSPKVLARKLK